MGDSETRADIAAKLRDGCPIRAIFMSRLQPVNCVYLLGENTDCESCTYQWDVIAEDTIDLMGRKLAAVRRERTRVRECRETLSNLCYETQELSARLSEAASNAQQVLMSEKQRAQLKKDRGDSDGSQETDEVQAQDYEGAPRGPGVSVDK